MINKKISLNNKLYIWCLRGLVLTLFFKYFIYETSLRIILHFGVQG